MDDAERGANATLTVDLEAKEIRGPDGGVVKFDLDEFRRHCLLERPRRHRPDDEAGAGDRRLREEERRAAPLGVRRSRRPDTLPQSIRKGHFMTTRKLFLLPGDGIGPEAMGEVRKLITLMNREAGTGFEIEEGLVGGAAYDAHGAAISEDDMARAMAADAVLFGAVGGPKWDGVAYEVRPEAGLLRLRKDLALFANLRPAICYAALADSSSLKKELVEGLDILIVRELTGGVYFGEPKEIMILATARSAPSTPRSTIPSRSSASQVWPSSWRARGPTGSARWKSTTS